MRRWWTVGFLLLLCAGCAATAPAPMVKEIDRTKRFVAYDNQTVKDLTTGLMWAAADNGSAVTWDEAKTYCRNYRGGGYEDWRMPTTEELKGLYNPRVDNPQPLEEGCKGVCHITRLIHLSCCPVWSWDGITEVETFFHFSKGPADWRDQSLETNHPRALPVREEK